MTCVPAHYGSSSHEGKETVPLKRPFTPDEKYEWITTAPLPGLIGSLAVPIIISMLITAVYNMADTFFVGHLGTSA